MLACCRVSFVLEAERSSVVRVCHTFSVLQFVHGHSGCFCILGGVDNFPVSRGSGSLFKVLISVSWIDAQEWGCWTPWWFYV